MSSRVGAAVVVAMASIAPLSTAAAAPMHATPLEEPVVSVTISDINASNRKIAAAYEALITMWTNQFRQIGVRFVAPRIARYDQAVMSSCGVMQSDNAEYCARNNTIFYDEVFVAGMTKRAALALGTDGDMAGIGIIAHEMGHAVATQLGH
ncbi:MAG TPA: neutral zinc metallopeptidase, partial [Gemmatimonadaceae bacterium]|nr:neutral zinc metallopeptidase [Gemmatimonadaceae bacterium]